MSDVLEAPRASVLLPPDPQARRALRLGVVRVLVAVSGLLGLYYAGWRWTAAINWSAWWIALPLVLAETYSLLDSLLFGITMWRLKERGAAPPPPEGATVDVFITTYNEDVELVRATAAAARDISWPHSTWILDDGARPEMRAEAERLGVGYLTRSADWADRPRHAKAGNLNNALFATSGEFLLILDADQVPVPEVLERTLGWFTDERVALVQTPQYFVNVTEADPLGSQAPLFYGPIQQGKDGWNAAFFCGSNAVLRRDALMQLGVVGYVLGVRDALRRALAASDEVLARARRSAAAEGPAVLAALDQVSAAVREARRAVKAGEPVSEVTYRFQRAVEQAGAGVVDADLAALQADLAALRELPFETDAELDVPVVDPLALEQLAGRAWSPLGAIEGVRELVRAVDVDRDDEAQPVMPLATISVTEDMATAMRLHGLGWRSVYHHEVLAHGLAPEDLGTMLQQRLRWAQGTLQVLLKENPLLQRRLSWGQRLMYLATMWTYLSGFAALVYLAAPVLYLCFGVRPVTAYGEDFLWHLLPYLVVNQLLFAVCGWGKRTWRGQQYSLALFPLWIRACTTAVGNVYFGQSLGFVVTPKNRPTGEHVANWRAVRLQLVAMGVLLLSVVVGLLRLAFGATDSGGGVLVNVLWVVYDLVIMSVVIDAALYSGPTDVPAPATTPAQETAP
ncbi:MAG: cellulose synthase [Frankiales bacterium]|nr:cellulose synthase [Frankiales bacterium]